LCPEIPLPRHTRQGLGPRTLGCCRRQTATGRLEPRRSHTVLQAITLLRHRAILMTAYAAGLRSPRSWLRVDDIDSQRMVIRLRQAKGPKIATSCSAPTADPAAGVLESSPAPQGLPTQPLALPGECPWPAADCQDRV
jgi:hypothetical protein